MLFLIVDKHSAPIISSHFKGRKIKEISSPIFDEDFKMLSISGSSREFLGYLLTAKVRGYFIPPYLSIKSFDKIYGIEVLKALKVVPTPLKHADFEDILSSANKLFPEHKGRYIYLNDLERRKSSKVDIGQIVHLNGMLQKYGLLISPEEYKVSLLSVFVKSLSRVDDDELREDSNDNKISEKNKTYYLLVIAEFIIQASFFYSKEEIKSFLFEHFINEKYKAGEE